MLSFFDNDAVFDEILREILAKKHSILHFPDSFCEKLPFFPDKQQSLCKLFEVLELGPDSIDPLYAATKARSLALKEKTKEIKLKQMENRVKKLENQLFSLEKLEQSLETEEKSLVNSEHLQKKRLFSLKKAQNELIIPKNQAIASALAGNLGEECDIIEEFGGFDCIPEDLEEAHRILEKKEEELRELDNYFE